MTAIESAFEASWRRELARRRARRTAYLALFVAALIASVVVSDFTPQRLIEGLPRTLDFFKQAAPDLQAPALFADEKTKGSLAYWYYRGDEWVAQLLVSIEMGVLSVVLGGIGAFCLSFLAARNLTPAPALGFAVRRLLEFLRTMPDLVLALIFVLAFGIGPLAGVLAIALHTIGALGKLFSEVNENIDMRPLEAVRGAGGTWPAAIRYGVLPQVMSSFASYALLRFEVCVGAAAAVGLVGAGGVGQELINAIDFGGTGFQDASAIMLMIIVTIFCIDLASESIRHRLIGLRRTQP